MNAPGSAFDSGTFDQGNRFKTFSNGGFVFDFGGYWKTAVDRMLAGLIYPDSIHACLKAYREGNFYGREPGTVPA